MNKPTPLPHASHVNTGTSIPHAELSWPECPGTVIGYSKLHIEQNTRPDVTNLGGLVLPLELMRRFDMPAILDSHVQVFKRHLPYHESDHIIAQALMLYAGGTCLEDLSMLQGDPAILKMLGAVRTPDPTTAGDFLRRFVPDGELESLTQAIDEIQNRVWSDRKRWRRWSWRRKKKPLAVLHLDGHIKKLSGVTREGADFSYNGKWSYGVLVASLNDGECVALRLRPGNVRSSDGAAELVDQTLPRLLSHFKTVLVVADSDYDRADLRKTCEKHECYYAFVGRELTNRPDIAMRCENWRPFETRARRLDAAKERSKPFRRRRKKVNRRRQKANARGYKDLQLARQIVGEVEDPNGARLILRRQLLDIHEGRPGQRELWHAVRYRYVITNLPDSWSPEEILDQTYQRCDQENLIAGLGTGIAAWRMPVAEMRGNAAWLEIARLAWNLGKWVAQLALPEEVSRWEWKRFRQTFVEIPVQLVRIARQTRVRILGTYRFADLFTQAHAALQI